MTISIGKATLRTAISNATTNTPMTWVGGGNTTPGSLIVVATSGYHASGYDGACEDGVNSPTTYAKHATGTYNLSRTMLQFYQASVAIPSVTQFHDQGTGCLGSCQAVEVLGIVLSGGADAQNPNTGDSALTDASCDLTTIAASTILFSVLGIKNADAALGIAGPTGGLYTNLGAFQDGTVMGFSFDYRIGPPQGLNSIAFTHSNGAGGWGIQLASFAEAAASSGSAAISWLRA